MKKLFYVFMVMISCQLVVNAQTKYRIGLQISPNLSLMPLEDVNATTMFNMGFGLTFNRYFDERYSIQSGVDALALSSRLTAGEDEIDLSASYIQVPFTIKMKTINFGHWTLFARVGAALGVKYIEDVRLSDPSITKYSPEDDLMDSFLLSFMGSVGTEYDLGIESSLFFSLDFNRSLLNQLNPQRFPMLENVQPRFSWITLNMGIIF